MFKMVNGVPTIKCLLMAILSLVSLSFADESEVPLSTSELKQKYGQDNTTFNDGKSCYRVCDGTRKICYYNFLVENYDTMSGLCGDCAFGVIKDCFSPGCIPGNGVQRNIMPVNRRLPGTPINVCKDDLIVVDVTNHMTGSELTIHWHGFYQVETPWMDGVPMVTQCPIFSGNTFRYAFNAREPGTHYYHAHTGVQRTNGLVGKINVREQNDPNVEFYDYDLKEHSILLADWNNYLAEEKVPGIKSAPLRPESILINGFGSFVDKKSGNHTYAPMEVFYVEKNKRHRFRIDNAASHNCPFEFCIKDHNLTVIATDGYSVEPLTVDCIVTQAGERYDVVMHAKPDFDEALISVRGLGTCVVLELQEFARIIFVDDYSTYTPKIEDHEPLAERPSYSSLDNTSRSTLNHPKTDCTDINSNSYCIAALESKNIQLPTGGSLRNEPVEKVFPFEFRIATTFDRPSSYFTAGDLAIVSMINNISATHSPLPLLTQDDSNVPFCNAENLPSNCDGNSICHCNHMIELELCKNYEFFLMDNGRPGDVSHPIHMHGFGFQVIDMGTMQQYAFGQTAFENSTKLPVVKDTVNLPSGGFVRIRFKSCNPGYWFFHCHFEYHMHVGMRAIIKVGNKTDMVPPPIGFPQCGNFFAPIHESYSD